MLYLAEAPHLRASSYEGWRARQNYGSAYTEMSAISRPLSLCWQPSLVARLSNGIAELLVLRHSAQQTSWKSLSLYQAVQTAHTGKTQINVRCLISAVNVLVFLISKREIGPNAAVTGWIDKRIFKNRIHIAAESVLACVNMLGLHGLKYFFYNYWNKCKN